MAAAVLGSVGGFELIGKTSKIEFCLYSLVLGLM